MPVLAWHQVSTSDLHHLVELHRQADLGYCDSVVLKKSYNYNNNLHKPPTTLGLLHVVVLRLLCERYLVRAA